MFVEGVQEHQEEKQWANSFQVSACTLFVNVSSTKSKTHGQCRFRAAVAFSRERVIKITLQKGTDEGGGNCGHFCDFLKLILK